MARGSALLDGSVLPPSRIVSERQAGLPRRFMPESATGREIVTLGEGRPAPHYPGRAWGDPHVETGQAGSVVTEGYG
uniref:Retrosat2 Ty3-Gypsy_retroelement-like n=1 Tax=Oryza rufipogon TaxID=4529 RepID=A0A679BD13_ORYRU|nr:Retrosat2 Ty3-Gypsy_retroelement-like [Oryza rufipogon]BBF90012.1 Retrosat2 Ty3-Gypsy_retroelement-like [Oryza rufipogon]